jgi:hypothetical protein
MKMSITLCIMLLTVVAPTAADCKSATFYTDGVMVEQEAAAVKGVLEIPLPSGMIDGSLRIKPGSGTVIRRVDIVPTPADTGKTERELDALLEQKNRLGDRLLALATREDIFKTAAKSQSGKAPRKTKTNPEPMQSIRQGTEFAIAQLEAVYTARRKTEQEIRRLDSRITSAKSNGRGAETFARIVISPSRGIVTVRYAVTGQTWTPRYDIYLNGSGSAQVSLSGLIPGTFAGYLLQASPAGLAESSTARVFPVQAGPAAGLVSYNLSAREEVFAAGIVPSFSFELKNMEPVHLPAGEANIYRNGEYVGKIRFEGISSGRSRRVANGR